MFGLGLPEILLILVVALLFFGAQRLPEIGRALGRSLSEFKKGMQEFTQDKTDNEKK
ncbi:MAG: twin-arginine translocase TatA/TatE family subunit [Candidatus Omnitrophica bacterium]|nr:twin-arginine translocase TatA/TatE family subunit [Candidatus Omnitrophota bacterium]